MSRYVLDLEGPVEEAILRRAEASGESPEVAMVRALEDAVVVPMPPVSDEDLEPEWVKELSPEMRERHRRIRALDRRLGLSKKPLTDAMFDRGWIYEGED